MSMIAFVIQLALAWFVYRLVRTPRDRVLRAVAACLVLQVLGEPGVIPVVVHWFGGTIAPPLAKLLMNLALDLSWFSLMLFFLLSAGGSWLRARVEAVLVTAVAAVMIWTMTATPDSVSTWAYPAGGALPPTIPIPEVGIFYLAGSAYFAYAAGQAARWAFGYGAESTGRARWGLRVAATGLAFLGSSAAIRAVFVVIRWTGGTVSGKLASPVDMLVPIGAVLFIGGVSYIGLAARLAALRVWAGHRRAHRQLRPLWEQLHTAFPHDALDRSPLRRWRDGLLPRRVHRRYWRRVVEIRDGLVQLSPHLADLGFRPEAPAHEQVGLVRQALDRQRRGAAADSRAAVLVASPAHGDSGADDSKADVEQLVHLARALTAANPVTPMEGAPA
ncbi:MAG TPA: MAB_1171c family putative transporter [Pseudonocardiaceae bacterium]|jgi:hypothetical protein|nr:MAB_1171c family putative transporter [Pseudonocardiaceae bacterium]